MKVIHLPIEISGQMGMLCGGLRYYGHQAAGYNYYHTSLGYMKNILPADGMEITDILGDAIEHFDVFHFHHLLTMCSDLRDLEMIVASGKCAVMHHWGSDVRIARIACQMNPYLVTTGLPPEQETHSRLLHVSSLISTAIVQDYEVFPFVTPYYKKVHVLPLAIDTSNFIPVYPSHSENNPLIVHAPSNPQVKGTDIIERVIDSLTKEVHFRYQRVENMSNAEAKKIYSQADIIIDQIITGSYGMLATESMALGKPVITYLREDLLGQYATKPPVCSANPDTLYEVLKQLLLNPELRFQRGVEGRIFVEQYHDIKVVIPQLIKIYEGILEDNRK